MMHALEIILAPLNLIFLIPLVLAVVWAAVSSLLGMMGDGDADMDADGDLDGDLEADTDLDGDADVEGGVGHLAHALSFMGFGRIPLILWLQLVGLVWGALGLGLAFLGLAFLVQIGVAGSGTLVVTGLLARLILRWMPPKRETDIIPWKDRIGMSGVVTTTKVDTAFGEGRFQGGTGTIYMQVRTQGGEIPDGTPIVVTGVNPQQRLAYVVAESELAG